MNGKNKRKPSIDSDSASSIVPTKKKKISTVKSLIQEKRTQIPDCKPSIWIFNLYIYVKLVLSSLLLLPKYVAVPRIYFTWSNQIIK